MSQYWYCYSRTGYHCEFSSLMKACTGNVHIAEWSHLGEGVTVDNKGAITVFSKKEPNLTFKLKWTILEVQHQYSNVDCVCVLTWTVSVCVSVRQGHDAFSFPLFELRTGYINGSVPRIFQSLQLTLSVSDPLTQTNTNSKRQPLQFVVHLRPVDYYWWPYTVPRVSMNPTQYLVWYEPYIVSRVYSLATEHSL